MTDLPTDTKVNSEEKTNEKVEKKNMSNASNIINIPTGTKINLEEKTTNEKVEKEKMSNTSNIQNASTDTNASTSPKDLKLVTTCLSEIATFLKKIDHPQLI